MRDDDRQQHLQQRLLRELRDPDKNTRANAAVELGKLGDSRAADLLVEALATEPDFFVREYLTWSIVRMAEAATPLLIRTLNDARPQARHGAAHTLSKIADPRATGALIATLQDGEPAIVSKAAFALGAIGAVESVSALVNLLGGEDRELQSTLVSVLERFGARALPAVIDALTHADARVRAHAAEVLGVIADPGCIPALTNALADDEGDVRFAAVHALANIDGEAAREAIRPMCNDADARVRALAAKMLDRAKKPARKRYSASSRPSNGN
jgi:HEAT repeat protein